MKKLSLVLMALLATLCFASGAYCAEGDELTTTNFRIDGNGEMWYQALTELATTNDTVTAAESGKTFIATTGGGYAHIKFALPAADEGLNYHFIQQGTGTLIELEPQSTETLLYSTAGAGDRLIGPATIGASVHIWASDDTTWFVETNGTFTVQID